MNSKRRAELQRKLTLNAVPRPPAGLAERIKNDIPNYLEAETAPAKFARSMNVYMRIAASVLLVVTSLAVAMVYITETREQELASSETPVIFAPQKRAVAMTDTMTTASAAARTEEVHLDIVEASPEIARLAAAGQIPPAKIEQEAFRDESKEQGRLEADDAEDRIAEAGVAAGGVIGGARADVPAQPTSAAEFAPEPEVAAAPREPQVAYAEPAPAVAPPAAPMRQQSGVALGEERAADTRRMRAAAPSAKTMIADGLDAKKDKDSVFGISTSAEVFHNIRTALESGQRPAASDVNVEALVNYFAGRPDKKPRRVNLEVEVSPAAIPADGDNAVLRFSIDTPDAASAPVLSNARIEVAINSAVVQRAHRMGDSDAFAGESILKNGTSVTGLYALALKPGLRSSQVIATVTLHYVEGGKAKSDREELRGADLVKTWQRATRRHRLASLGALWGESLKNGAAGGAVVARRAEELATQEPDDERARELARAASVSAAGGR